MDFVFYSQALLFPKVLCVAKLTRNRRHSSSAPGSIKPMYAFWRLGGSGLGISIPNASYTSSHELFWKQVPDSQFNELPATKSDHEQNSLAKTKIMDDKSSNSFEADDIRYHF